MNTRISLVLVLAWFALAWLALSGRPLLAQGAEPAAQQVHSMAWVVEHRREWSGWGSIGRRLIVEGRYSFVTPNKLRMGECSLDFVPAKGETLRRPTSESRNVEIEGRMAIVDGSPVFVVESLVARPTDETTYRTRLAAVQRGEPADWHALADWAEARAAFYDDATLRERAVEARIAGHEAEREALDDADADGLLALAGRVADRKIAPRLAAEYRHAGWRARWQALSERAEPATAGELEDLAAQLAKALPGARTPPATPTDDEADELAERLQAYRTVPGATYRTADDALRRRLHRAFYGEVALPAILRDLDEAARNETAIADRIVERLPEFAAVADELRERAITRELARVPSMTQAEMAALADRFRKSGDPARAGRVVADWLAAKEERLRPEGAEGLVEAADFYESLTADRDKVAALLVEAHGLRPDADAVRVRLERLGYRLSEGRWTTDPAPAGGHDRRHPLGIAIGATAEQVVATLGTPRAISRIATADELTEIWIYGPRDAAGFAIHIARPRRPRSPTGTGEGKVVRIAERRPR